MNICPKRSEKKGWKNLLANMKVKSRLLVGWKSLMIGKINRVSFWDIYTFIKKKNTIHREYSLQIKELLTTFRNFKFNSMLSENFELKVYLVEHFFHYFSSFFLAKPIWQNIHIWLVKRLPIIWSYIVLIWKCKISMRQWNRLVIPR